MSLISLPPSPMVRAQDFSPRPQQLTGNPESRNSDNKAPADSSVFSGPAVLSRLQNSWHNYTHIPLSISLPDNAGIVETSPALDEDVPRSYDDRPASAKGTNGNACPALLQSGGSAPPPAAVSAATGIAISGPVSAPVSAPVTGSVSAPLAPQPKLAVNMPSTPPDQGEISPRSTSASPPSPSLHSGLVASPTLYRKSNLNIVGTSAAFLRKQPRGYNRDAEIEKERETTSHTTANSRAGAIERGASASSVSSNDSTSSAPIVRKKSGERVKSSLKLSSLARTQSLPSTPSKMVHFDANLEQIRRFSRMDQPQAVSETNSPVDEVGVQGVEFHWGDDSSDSSSTESDDEELENVYDTLKDSVKDSYTGKQLGLYRYLHNTEWDISLPNFVLPVVSADSPVVLLENVFLSKDRSSVIGHVLVKNIAFNKSVVARYTVDYWRTATEVFATYNEDIRRRYKSLGFDKFTFVIKLTDLPQHALRSKSMFFCVRYGVDGTDYWDNNNSYNYQVDFCRVPKSGADPKFANGRRPRRDSQTHKRSQSHPNFGTSFSEDVEKFAKPSLLSHQQQKELEIRSDSPTRPSAAASASSTATRKPKIKKLTSRYSFGASFRRQERNGSGDYDETTTDEDDSFTFPKQSMVAATEPSTAAKTLQPAWDSLSYQDLLNKYCFFMEKKETTPPKDAKEETTEKTKEEVKPSVNGKSARTQRSEVEETRGRSLNRDPIYYPAVSSGSSGNAKA